MQRWTMYGHTYMDNQSQTNYGNITAYPDSGQLQYGIHEVY